MIVPTTERHRLSALPVQTRGTMGAFNLSSFLHGAHDVTLYAALAVAAFIIYKMLSKSEVGKKRKDAVKQAREQVQSAKKQLSSAYAMPRF